MNEEQQRQVDWLTLPAGVWAEISEFMPAKDNQLFNLVTTHPEINRKVKKDYRFKQRELDATVIKQGQNLAGFFATPITFSENLDDLRKYIYAEINDAFGDEARADEIKSKLLKMLKNPKHYKKLNRRYNNRGWLQKHGYSISTFHRALFLIATGLLCIEAMSSANKKRTNKEIISLIERKPNVDKKQYYTELNLSFFDIMYTALSLATAAVFLTLGPAFIASSPLTLICLCSPLAPVIAIVDVLIAGIVLTAIGAGLILGNIPIKAAIYTHDKKKLRFIDDVKDYFDDKENDAPQLQL